MKFSMSVSEDVIDKLLIRLREATIFIIKGDGLAIAALATLASVFKLESQQILEVSASLIWVFEGLISLATLSMVIWAFFVVLSPSSDVKVNFFSYWGSIFAFFSLTLLHTLAIAYSLGYLSGYLGCLVGKPQCIA